MRKAEKVYWVLRDINSQAWTEEVYEKTLQELPQNFENREGKLFWNGLEVILAKDKDTFLNELYFHTESPARFFGRDKMYQYVKERYAGISKRDIESFLQNLNGRVILKKAVT